ncbi:hypothetical protein Q2K19_31390 [Micromonospora soli]|uniref:hypothetical protein n=1 Tax=Micromonospora sp. NBRC 110009 TaxID=3061627 RepID=UPI002670DD32|nr:hypothetical protein [Micromonospora sp. NBRC 110009]WKT98598.1 hypothetical protein Q2K19_31390 [Micromonospora sp. NBRC 110009]
MVSLTLASSGPPNLPQLAGYYSQLAGVLAGFSFAGLVALATVRLGPENEDEDISVRHSVAPLTSAFIALVASSLDYAIVTGEVAGTPRVAALQTIAGMGFSIAGITLVFSTLVLLSDLRHHVGSPAIRLLTNTSVLILPPVLVLLMWGGLRDHLGQKYGAQSNFVRADWIALCALAVTLLAVIGFRVTSFRVPIALGRQVAALANTAALLAFLSLVGSTVLITFTTAESTISDIVPISSLLLVTAFCIATAYSADQFRASLQGLPQPMPHDSRRAQAPAPGFPGRVTKA